MTYSRDATTASEVTSQHVSIWSEEWQHECEAKAVLAMSKTARDAIFDRSTGEDGQRKEHGVTAIRRSKSVEALKGLQEAQGQRLTSPAR
ncbi:hypothetical protein JKG68_29240 [Microvirga aerilata]|uniref:Uncharacterized protein n=1 Tax=Microvirga aerilata TaxID=670292 RepID=A0A937D3N3_9HYPH|nr:hypothetical protein [Microvirga aerilata]MBL0407987.1 hypothetical protein [Microvirga aerilata]